MIIREPSNGELVIIGQTDHSRFVGQLAARWGNSEIPKPDPWESVVRAAIYHDYGWLTYETNPLINEESGEPYQFLQLPLLQRQLESYQWCVDWLAGTDIYSALIVSRHRTGLWKGRYGFINHPSGKYDLSKLDAAIVGLIERNESWQEQVMSALDPDQRKKFPTNYRLLQVWDLLGLYFCCQEPYNDYVDPIPTSYEREDGVRMSLTPAGPRQVKFEPYPFDERPLKTQIACKRVPQASFRDIAEFREAYFKAPNELLEYEMV